MRWPPDIMCVVSKAISGPQLHRARDASRDQSYFLFATTREQLAFLRFPLGGLEKREVRSLATELGLAVAEKPDSQDICFVPDGDYAKLVARLRPDTARPGEIVDAQGRVLGRHDGVIHFTIGQRKGLGLSGKDEPLFVLALDAARARVVVGPRECLRMRTIRLRDVNWLADPSQAQDCVVKVRSTRPGVSARVVPLADSGAEIDIAGGEESVAPGQACVFYEANGTRVLGGGWIVSAAARAGAVPPLYALGA